MCNLCNVHFYRLKIFKKLPLVKRNLCQNCGLLLMPDELSEHSGHKLLPKVSKLQLLKPTKLLQPLSNNKSNAVSNNLTFNFQFTHKLWLKFTYFTEHCIKSNQSKFIVTGALNLCISEWQAFFQALRQKRSWETS